MYLRISGFWKTKEGYLDDLETACKAMNASFDLMVDLTTMVAPKKDVGQVHVDAQLMLMKYGLIRTAEILGDDVIAKMALR
ncbi:MAG: hypothetical protein AAF551_05680, partial [Bacteroidota bacterium]